MSVRATLYASDVKHPKDIGDRTTLAVMLALRDFGYAISVPFGENTRYDLVIDDGVMLQRVQCKTGRLREGAILFNTASSYAHHSSARDSRRPYDGQIDHFGVYCPSTSGVYLIPIGEVTCRTAARLRVAPSRNGQRKRVREASAYQIATVEVPTATVTRAPRASSGARGSSA